MDVEMTSRVNIPFYEVDLEDDSHIDEPMKVVVNPFSPYEGISQDTLLLGQLDTNNKEINQDLILPSIQLKDCTQFDTSLEPE